MNLLTITLCVLIKAIMILAKTERLTNFSDLESFFDSINLEKTGGSTNFSESLFDSINLAKFLDIRAIPEELYKHINYHPESNKSLYNYNYNTDTGIQVQEGGHFNKVGTNEETLEARGNYSYTDNEGNIFHVSYIANENGFQPEGAHLPTVPPLIKKSLQYIAKHTEKNGKE